MPRRARARLERHHGAKSAGGIGQVEQGSIRTEPVKFSAGRLTEGREPHRLISIVSPFH